MYEAVHRVFHPNGRLEIRLYRRYPGLKAALRSFVTEETELAGHPSAALAAGSTVMSPGGAALSA